jgi:large subunit ribosomal protein L6
MSRIGNKPIQLPSGVEFNIDGSTATVKGNKGTLTQVLNPDISVEIENGSLIVKRPSDAREHRAFHGLTRALLANMVTGVSEGYRKTLELIGAGYRAQQSGNGISLQVGYSHLVSVMPPEGVSIEVEGNNRIHVSGISKQSVGQIAANIRRIRRPNVYTGKGIRYEGEIVRLKPGKSAGRN